MNRIVQGTSISIPPLGSSPDLLEVSSYSSLVDLSGGASDGWLVGENGKDTLDKGTGKDKISYGNECSKDLWEKVQGRLIDWTGEFDDPHVPGNRTCHYPKVTPCASWVKDFVIDLAGSNGTHNPNGEIKIVLSGGDDGETNKAKGVRW